MNLFDPIRFHSIRIGSIRFDAIRFDSIRFESIRFDSIRFDSPAAPPSFRVEGTFRTHVQVDAVGADDVTALDVALFDHVELVADVALVEERLARLERLDLSDRRHRRRHCRHCRTRRIVVVVRSSSDATRRPARPATRELGVMRCHEVS